MIRRASIFAACFLAGGLIAQTRTDRAPSWDALLLASFDQGAGTDRSYSNRTPTVASGATFPSGYRTADLDGTSTAAVSWPGSSDFSALPLTVVCWVRIDAYTSLRAIVGNMAQATAYRGWCLYYSPGLSSRGLIWHQVDSADASVATGEYRNGYAPVGNLSAGSWYHVAATAENFTSAPLLYINGVSQSVTAGGTGASITTLGTEALKIGLKGGPEAGLWSFHDGGVDDLKIFKRVLSASEIAAIYAEGIGVSRP